MVDPTPTAAHTVKSLTSDVFRRHQFQSSRPWPDGTRPTGPDWNPGCTCGASHYYFEHPCHLAELTYEYITAGLTPELRAAVDVAVRQKAREAYRERYREAMTGGYDD